MNKRDFIKVLSNSLGYSIEDCTIINDILEDNFFISRKNKDRIITELVDKLNITNKDADKIYEVSISILTKEIKNKLKHPFGN